MIISFFHNESLEIVFRDYKRLQIVYPSEVDFAPKQTPIEQQQKI